MELSIGRYEISGPLPDPSRVTCRMTGPDEFVLDVEHLLIYATLANLVGLQQKITAALVEAGYGSEVNAA